MIFASFEFVFLFLPAFLAIYFVTPAPLRNWPVLLLSWLFYAWWRVDFLALLVGVTVFTFAIARLMDRLGPRTIGGKRLLVLGLAGNLGVLGYFKYANFGVSNFNQLIVAQGGQPLAWTAILLPIGLSFYVLQSVSYLVDLWRGTVPVSRRFVDYAAYKAMFSQLIAGPIVRYAEVAQELRDREHSLAIFGRGARRFMTGFAMKVLLADTLSPMVDAIFALPAPSLLEAWTGTVAYALQLFFDFAGYSAMAIGLALICGFHFPENFNRPYLSGNIQEFWQGWHMTLGRFLRDYLYVPLGGSRGGAWRTTLNLILTMAIGGFWHGANWTFLIWGLWHGGLLAAHRAWRRHGHGPMPYGLANPLLLLAVALGWVMFRAPDLPAALTLYRGMLGLHGFGVSDELAWQITPDQWWCLLIAAVLAYLPLLARNTSMMRPPEQNRPLWRLGWAVLPCTGFLLSLALLYSRAAVPFLYFQF